MPGGSQRRNGSILGDREEIESYLGVDGKVWEKRDSYLDIGKEKWFHYWR